MNIDINRNWRVHSDPNQWIVQKRRIVKGCPKWESLSYHHTLDSAVVWLAQKRVRLMRGKYGPDALPILCQALDRLSVEIRAALRSTGQ